MVAWCTLRYGNKVVVVVILVFLHKRLSFFFLVHPAIAMFYLEHMTLRFVSVIFFLVFCSMNNKRWTTNLPITLETKLG